MRLRTWRPEITFFPTSFQLFLRQRMPISISGRQKTGHLRYHQELSTGLSGKLESGDIVTVIVADYQGKGETAIPPELQYVEVISVTASSGTMPTPVKWWMKRTALHRDTAGDH